jgi:arabinofuranosyltransferase
MSRDSCLGNAAAVIAVALVGVIAAWHSRMAMSDDAFISMRIVRNALEGHGLHFNAGESGVQAATSPLNLLMMIGLGAIGHLFGASIEDAVLAAPGALLMLALPAMGLGLLRLCSGRSGASPAGVIVAAAAALCPLVVATCGLETVLLMALVLWALHAYSLNRWTLCGTLLGLAILARHDAIILAVLVLASTWAASRGAGTDARPALMQLLTPTVLVLGPWLAFSALYFGETVPTTLQSKLAQGGTIYWPGPYYAQTWGWLEAIFWGQPLVAAGICLLGAAGAYRAVGNRREPASRSTLLLIGFLTLQFAAYSLMRLPDYHWYFVPYAIGILAAAGYCLTGLLPARSPFVAGASVVALGAAMAAVPHLPMEDERLVPYREVAHHLATAPPVTAVGLMEIGMIGFFAPRVRVFDFGGIVTPSQSERIRGNDASGWLENPSVADVVVVRGDPHQLLEPFFDTRFEKLYSHEWTSPPSKAFPGGLQVWRLKR